METAEIAKVAVAAAPYTIDKPYDYLLPPELLEKAVPGVRVMVPFGRGNKYCEGMGGTAGGQKASRIAVSTYVAEVKKALAPGMSPEQLLAVSASAVSEANRAVRQEAERCVECKNMKVPSFHISSSAPLT